MLAPAEQGRQASLSHALSRLGVSAVATEQLWHLPRPARVVALKPPFGRWTAARKAVVVTAIRFDLVERAEALRELEISDEELNSWADHLDTHGARALSTTKIQYFRPN